MIVNITTCMHYREGVFGAGRKRCQHLSKGTFGGYICKQGHQIDSVPRIGQNNQVCKDKDISITA